MRTRRCLLRLLNVASMGSAGHFSRRLQTGAHHELLSIEDRSCGTMYNCRRTFRRCFTKSMCEDGWGDEGVTSSL